MTVTRFLDPATLGRIANLELLARTVVDGFISGLHQAPHLGVSIDFAEHRPYMPGDDVRRIDWRVFGRTDRLYLKEYEADTNANFCVLLDVSRSMDYGSRGITKLEYGRYLAACLSYLSRRQRDRVGLFTFDAAIQERVPPSARHLEAVLHALDRARVGSAGALEPPLRRVAESLRRRSLLLVISDLYDPPEETLRAVTHLRAKGSDVIVFQVLDPAEIEFPFEAPSQFEDLETGERWSVVPDRVRADYRRDLGAHLETIARLMARDRIDYRLCPTSDPLDHALFDYLSRRHRLARVR